MNDYGVSEISRPYDVWHDDMARELIDTLTTEELRALHAILRKQGLHGWNNWLTAHAGECERYLSATPSERKKRRFHEDQTRLLTAYGALWLAQMGSAMGPWFHDPTLAPGHGYPRSTLAARGRAVLACLRVEINPWPFDDPEDLSDPFECEDQP